MSAHMREERTNDTKKGTLTELCTVALCINPCVHVYVLFICVYVYICDYIHIGIHVYMCVYTYIYIHVYTNRYICIYVHTHI